MLNIASEPGTIAVSPEPPIGPPASRHPSQTARPRGAVSLDGPWDFHFCGDAALAPDAIGSWRSCVVPAPWQAQFADLRERNGRAWYRRDFDLPEDWAGSAIVLRFGAVHYHARVLVNGIEATQHEGGYLPFEVGIEDLVRPGSNELMVEVTAPTDDPEHYPLYPVGEIPFGKQSWYGPLGGIWQSVTIERRSVAHIRALRILPCLRNGRVTVSSALALPMLHGCKLHFEIAGPDGEPLTTATEPAAVGQDRVEVTIALPDPQPWSPDTPRLYRLKVTLARGDELLDSVEESFGFRTIEARDGRLYLNGEPLYLRGALDQDYYPDGICTPPSEAFLEDQFRKAKALGLNCLRCHIKVPDPRYYAVADRLGMLIWSELPNVGRLTALAAARLEATLDGVLERDGNHPSIVCWTIINENWGTDLVHDAEHRAWLSRTYHRLKAQDPTRLVVDNSPTWPNFHVETDLDDFHCYAGIPDQRRGWDDFVTTLPSRPAWGYSPFGDGVRSGKEPLICSEFGTWGLPDPADLKDADGQEPWWFETGHDWGESVMYPHGVENRFHVFGLDEVFGSLRGFALAAQWQQFRALKYQIEAMRRQPALAGYVITELTDCHWEANGLLDMRRNPRAFHDRFASINADTVIVPRWQRTACWAGEPVEVGLALAHGRGDTMADAALHWSLEGGDLGGVEPVEVTPGVQDLGGLSLRAPELPQAGLRQLKLEVVRDGQVLASNVLDLAVHPRREGPPIGRVAVWSPDSELAERFQALGYRTAPTLREADLVVTRTLDEDILARMREGGRVVLLVDRPLDLQPAFPHWQGIRTVRREGTMWHGCWASSFSWLRRSGPFARLPGGPLLDDTFDRVIPEHVIVGLNSWNFRPYGANSPKL